MNVVLGRQGMAKGLVRAKRLVSVQDILTWAFATEHARLWSDDHLADPERSRGYGLEYLMIQQAQLGCRVDGGGASDPHVDADAVATVVGQLPEGLGGGQMAVTVTALARAGLAPNWMPGALPRLVPRGCKANQHGWVADTEVAEVIRYRHRGRMVTREVRFCPVTYSPSPAQIASARRGYLDWWGALQAIRTALQGLELRDHVISPVMPKMQPWKKALD